MRSYLLFMVLIVDLAKIEQQRILYSVPILMDWKLTPTHTQETIKEPIKEMHEMNRK